MNGLDNVEISQNLNGWQNTGKVLQWIGNKLTSSDFQLYYDVVRRTVGYNQYTSDFTSYKDFSLSTGLSIKTVQRSMKKLIEQKYVVKVTTNQLKDTGKLPYKYQLNMKLEGFPSLGKLASSREAKQTKPIKVEEVVDTYYTDDYLIYSTNSNNAVMYKNIPNLPEMTVKAFRDNTREPTVEELTEYLNKQLDTKFIVLEGDRDGTKV